MFHTVLGDPKLFGQFGSLDLFEGGFGEHKEGRPPMPTPLSMSYY